MKERPIAFLDSGVGGLPYLSEAQKQIPDENFVYVADNENFPYGGKNFEQLKKVVISVIERIVDQFNPKTVVIACNTASVITLKSLRKRFGIPFVGVVPAVKPAAQYSQNGRIGLLATESTVKSIYTDDLIRDFARDCSVFRFAGVQIVDFVENRYYGADEDEIYKILSPAVEYFTRKQIDSLILGCTHFLFVREPLQKLMGKEIKVIDSVDGVVKQLGKILQDTSPAGGNNKSKYSRFYITGTSYSREKYEMFINAFDLEWGGSI